MAKLTKIGISPTPRHWPNHTSTDLADAHDKAAVLGGHVQWITEWTAALPVPVLSVLQQMAYARGLKFGLTLSVLTLTPPRDQPAIPAGLGTSFTEPAVRQAYIQKVLEYAALKPQWLGLATEINLLWPNQPEYQAFVSLAQEAAAAVRAADPLQRLLISFQWDLMILGQDPLRFQPLVDFGPALDVYALTSYPYTYFSDPSQIPPNYYSAIRQLLPTQAIGISEIGYAASSGTTEPKQAQFCGRLFSFDQGLGAEFISWALLHDISAFGGSLDFCGLRYNAGAPKVSYNTFKNLPAWN